MENLEIVRNGRREKNAVEEINDFDDESSDPSLDEFISRLYLLGLFFSPIDVPNVRAITSLPSLP